MGVRARRYIRQASLTLSQEAADPFANRWFAYAMPSGGGAQLTLMLDDVIDHIVSTRKR